MQLSKEFCEKYPNTRYGYPEPIAITFEGMDVVERVVNILNRELEDGDE